jgi:hypothetical protein
MMMVQGDQREGNARVNEREVRRRKRMAMIENYSL